MTRVQHDLNLGVMDSDRVRCSHEVNAFFSGCDDREMLWTGERAFAVDERVEAERAKEAGVVDAETQVEDHGASGKQTEGW